MHHRSESRGERCRGNEVTRHHRVKGRAHALQVEAKFHKNAQVLKKRKNRLCSYVEEKQTDMPAQMHFYGLLR